MNITTNSPVIDQRTTRNIAKKIIERDFSMLANKEEANYFEYAAWQHQVASQNQNIDQVENIYKRYIRFNFEKGKKIKSIAEYKQHKMTFDARELKKLYGGNHDSLKSLLLMIYLHVLGYYVSPEELQIYDLTDVVNDDVLSKLLGNMNWLDSYKYNVYISDAVAQDSVNLISENMVDHGVNDRFLQFLVELENNHYALETLPAVFQHIKFSQAYNKTAARECEELIAAKCLFEFKCMLTCFEYSDSLVLVLSYNQNIVPDAVSEYILGLCGNYLTSLEMYLKTLPAKANFMLINEQLRSPVLEGMETLKNKKVLLANQIQSVLKNKGSGILLRDLTKSYSGEDILKKINLYSSIIKNNITDENVVICLALPRSADYIIWLLAIFTTGTTALLLDIQSDEKTISSMLVDTTPALIIIDGNNHFPWVNSYSVFDICTLSQQTSFNEVVAETTSSDDGIAYVIYTSGTTGKPKKITIRYGAFQCYCDNLKNAIALSENDHYAVTAALGFSSFFRQIFFPLLSGAELILFDDDHRTYPNKFFQALSKFGITVIDVIPSFIEILLGYLSGNKELVEKISVRLILSASEPLKTTTAIELKKYMGSVELINMYGQTETSGIVSYEVVKVDHLFKQFVPIGLPFPNTKIAIMDSSFNLTPRYAVGQLAISTPCFADNIDLLGKVIMGEKTNWYLTGDLGYIDERGELNFVSRYDLQVKLHGKRFTLAQVNEALESHLAVKKAVTLLDENKKILFSFIQSADHQKPSQIELLHHIRLRLPKHMLPSLFFYKEAFPLTQTGKLNIRALQEEYEHYTKNITQSLSDYVSSFKEGYEQSLYYIISDLTNTLDIRSDNDFISLGMTSFKFAALIQKVAEQMDIELSLTDVFRYTSIEKLAIRLEALVQR